MREIKFRVWDAENHEMFFPKKIEWNTQGELRFFNKYQMWQRSMVLMQYTGLKDTKDKEIYEGDILEYEDDHHVGQKQTQVIWIECTARFGLQNLDIDKYGAAEFGMEGKHHIIIGNIYENPELFEVKK